MSIRTIPVSQIKDIRPEKDNVGNWFLCRMVKSGKWYLYQSRCCLVMYNDKYNGLFNNCRSQAVRKLTAAELDQLQLKTNW